MTETIEPMTQAPIDQQFAQDLVDRARAEGVDLTGPGGLLTGLTKQVLETALETELAEHLGYDKHDPAGRNRANSRNGTRSKTVLTEIGPVEIDVPRDREGSFEPVIVKKRQRRLSGIDNAVLALTARGLTTGEVEAFFDETYGVHLGKDTISRITEKVIEEMTDWCHRPLDSVYPVVFVDAVYVKIRDGQVVNRPIYVALAVTTNGEREILGLWAGDGSEGAKYWLSVLSEIKNRGVADVCIVVCDGLKGLPDAINTVWPAAIVQACVLHLIRNSFPLRRPPRLGEDGQGPAPDLPGHQRRRGRRPAGGVRRRLGPEVPGDHATCGAQPGRNSHPSSNMTSRYARSSRAPTRSSPSTPATAARSEPGATSRPSSPRSNACTW